MLDTAAVKAAIAVWFLAHPNYQPHHQQAIYQRIHVESRFDPNASNGAGCMCLLQWLGPRARGVTGGSGRCPEVAAQLDYMDSEFQSNRRFNAFFRTGPGDAYAFIRDVYAGGRDARRRPHLAHRGRSH